MRCSLGVGKKPPPAHHEAGVRAAAALPLLQDCRCNTVETGNLQPLDKASPGRWLDCCYYRVTNAVELDFAAGHAFHSPRGCTDCRVHLHRAVGAPTTCFHRSNRPSYVQLVLSNLACVPELRPVPLLVGDDRVQPHHGGHAKDGCPAARKTNGEAVSQRLARSYSNHRGWLLFNIRGVSTTGGAFPR